VSQNDVIAFRPPNKDFQLTWFDRQGNLIAAASDVGPYSGVALSPDGARILTAKAIVGANIDQDIWILETSRAAMRKATFGPLLEDRAVWSADGRRFMFTIGGDVGTLFEQGIDTAVPPRLLLETKQHKIPTSASRDGRFLLYTVENIDRSRDDVWVLPLLPGAKEFPLIQRDFDQEQGQFSPDRRWVAYVSNESGRSEVLLRRFIEQPDQASSDPQTIAVSAAGGTAPRWRADGNELYFFGPDGSVMAVDVNGRATLSVGTPHALFRLAGSHGDWDVLPDGSRFLIAIPPGADASPPFTVLCNRLGQLPVPERR
jgi:Tol biopolymer transport system component